MADLDFSKIRTHSLHGAHRTVHRHQYAKAMEPGATVAQYIESLPKVLAVKDLTALAIAIVEARRRNRPVLLQFGGHVIKCGLGPLIIDLLSRGWVTALAVNGSVAIHDLEFAMVGATSEDVAGNLERGDFGMAQETASFMNRAAVAGRSKGFGLALGELMEKEKLTYAHESVIAAAVRMERRITVHVAIGTDVVHQHDGVDGAALGAATLADFQAYCGVVADLDGGGVVVNVGSAVILPEVFLKAVSVSRNLGYKVQDFTAANLDMIRHYRPSTNVIGRPVQTRGRGINITGHHELVFPLLHLMILHYSTHVQSGG